MQQVISGSGDSQVWMICWFIKPTKISRLNATVFHVTVSEIFVTTGYGVHSPFFFFFNHHTINSKLFPAAVSHTKKHFHEFC